MNINVLLNPGIHKKGDKQMIGDLILCLMILAGNIIFIWANVTYTPNKEETKMDALPHDLNVDHNKRQQHTH